MAITLMQVCDAVADTLEHAAGMTRTQSYNELTEGINSGDLPLLQVYFESFLMDQQDGLTDRTSFQAAVRQVPFLIRADVFATQRGNIGQDISRTTEIADDVLDILQGQDTKPYFGLVGIKAWNLHSAQRVTFEYADAKYPGIRFELMIWVY